MSAYPDTGLFKNAPPTPPLLGRTKGVAEKTCASVHYAYEDDLFLLHTFLPQARSGKLGRESRGRGNITAPTRTPAVTPNAARHDAGSRLVKQSLPEKERDGRGAKSGGTGASSQSDPSPCQLSAGSSLINTALYLSLFCQLKVGLNCKARPGESLEQSGYRRCSTSEGTAISPEVLPLRRVRKSNPNRTTQKVTTRCAANKRTKRKYCDYTETYCDCSFIQYMLSSNSLKA